MIRTKDLVLFVTVLLFLFTGISYTLIRDTNEATDTKTEDIVFNTEELDLEATVSGDDFDRTAYINNLRAKLAAGEGQILDAPPVFESVDTIKEESKEDTKDGFVSTRVAVRCAVSENIDEVLVSWPQVGISVSFVEGARLVIMSEEVVTGTGTSTSVEIVERTLLQLPISQTRMTESSCLKSDLIGVTSAGELIQNSDTWKYVNYDETELIGYARDGFPIYGVLDDPDVLDGCGGYDNGEGYRYNIRPDADFILWCYAGTPSDFLIK